MPVNYPAQPLDVDQGYVVPTNYNVTQGPSRSLQGFFGNLAGGNNVLLNGLLGGYGMGQTYFGPGSLGRLDTQITRDEATALYQARQLMQQNPRMDEQQAAIGGLRGVVGGLSKLKTLNGSSSAAMSSGLERLRQVANQVDMSASMRNALSQQGQLAETAGDRPREIQNLINQRQAGLGGLTAPENQALLEQGQLGLNSALQTAMRQNATSNAAAGRRGGVANIANQPAMQNFANASAQLQRDITLANVAERNQRLNELQGLITGQNQQQFNQALAAQGQFGNTAGGFQNQIQGQDLAANQAYAQTAGDYRNILGSLQNQAAGLQLQGNLGLVDQLMQQRNSDIQNQLGMNTGFTNVLGGIQTRLRENQVYNLNNLRSELAGQLGSIYGGMDIASGRQANERAYKLAQRQLDILAAHPEAGTFEIPDMNQLNTASSKDVQDSLGQYANRDPNPINYGSTPTASGANNSSYGYNWSGSGSAPSWYGSR